MRVEHKFEAELERQQPTVNMQDYGEQREAFSPKELQAPRLEQEARYRRLDEQLNILLEQSRHLS
jgi:hypothetical protein